MLNSRGSFDRLSQPKPNRWGVAKLVRRLTLDQVILGSNPSAPAIRFSEPARPYLGKRIGEFALLYVVLVATQPVGLELSRLPYEQENARDDQRKNHSQEP